MKNVSLLLDFTDEYQILGVHSRCVDFLDSEVDSATLCEETAEGRDHLLQLLAIVAKHRLEKHTQTLMAHAVKIPTKHLELFNPAIDPSVMQQVLASKGKHVWGYVVIY